MKRLHTGLIAIAMVLAIASLAFAGSVNIRLKDGSRWTGELQDPVHVKYVQQGVTVEFQGDLVTVTDMYIKVKGDLAGTVREKVIFRADIVAMTTIEDAPAGDSRPARPKPSASGNNKDDDPPVGPDGREIGVFLLPLEGPVGEMIRYDEIKAIGEHADTYGRGQIIVLVINTNGGLVLESELIDETIQDIQKRHRVVAWVKKAISAGCSLAMACEEIYFMTEGTAGSVTTVRGTQSLSEEEAADHVDALVKTAKRNGYSEHIARAMKLNKYMCSYDKDPETGEVTWYGDASGEFVLSTDQQNLTFNSSNALHCGFSKGTADTEEDLARLLDLPKWHEIDSYGREIAANWKTTAERAQEEIPRLWARRSYYKNAGSAREKLGALIRIDRQLIRWWDRAPNICRSVGLPPKEDLEREIEELRRALSQLR